VLPSYFAANQWSRVLYYTAGRGALENGGKNCVTCIDESLTVDGVSGYDVVLLTPGHATGAGKRSGWVDYIDDVENRNDDDRYATPLAQAAGRDRLYMIRGRSR
jgi:hypothetical protein